MKYLNKEEVDKRTARQLADILTTRFDLYYAPYIDDEEARKAENELRLELIECIKEKILSGNA